MKLKEAVNTRGRYRRTEPLGAEREIRSWLFSKRVGSFLLFNTLYGVVFASYLINFFRFFLHKSDYPHPGLIPLVSLYLMFIRREELLARARYGFLWGLPLLVAGGGIYVMGLHLSSVLSPNDFFSLTALGLITVWSGGFVICFGTSGAWTVLFPLLFLIFAVPPPEALIYHLTTVLQHASVEMTYFLFTLLPLPVYREGVHFMLPGLAIEVARECSSIRSSMALVITSVLMAHFLLRYWWSKAVVWLLVLPLSVFKNGLRIVTLCMLTIYVDRGFLSGKLHTQGGAVFFGITLVIQLFIIIGLRKVEAMRKAEAK